MSERKLQKCKICNEWFNTTEEVMLDHHFNNHLTISPFKITSITLSCDFEAFKEAHAKLISSVFNLPVLKIT